MSPLEITASLEVLQLSIESIEDEKVRASLVGLLNLVEALARENETLREENQRLKDEINRLKGEQGKPQIKGKKRKGEDISSERERQGDSKSKGKSARRGRGSKRARIKIDRVKRCSVDRDDLPADAVFKGYESVIVQDLKIVTDNIEFKREIFYSPSQKKTYRGQLPSGYQGAYGPRIKALIVAMKHQCNMSQPKILEFLHSFEVDISGAYIAKLLTEDQGIFHAEKAELYRAALGCGAYQQIDDTSARVNGENHYTQILCNEWYTVYFTTAHKDRLTILDVLRDFAPRQFMVNGETLSLLEHFRVSKKLIMRLQAVEKDRVFNEQQFNEQLDRFRLGKRQRWRILEAAAIAAYHQDTQIPVVKLLLSDDAGQFKLLTEQWALCWVHDARHYKKLTPVVPQHQEKLQGFRNAYWVFYDQLARYKNHPTCAEAHRLSEQFDRLFSTRTGYEQLDERIAKTETKKEALLMVLRHPELPLHNNAAELGARAQARARDVSLHTKSKAGTKAKDTFMSVVQTAKKLGVNVYDYFYDRISGRFMLPSLAQLIREKNNAQASA
jgi:hypothetical protein